MYGKPSFQGLANGGNLVRSSVEGSRTPARPCVAQARNLALFDGQRTRMPLAHTDPAVADDITRDERTGVSPAVDERQETVSPNPQTWRSGFVCVVRATRRAR